MYNTMASDIHLVYVQLFSFLYIYIYCVFLFAVLLRCSCFTFMCLLCVCSYDLRVFPSVFPPSLLELLFFFAGTAFIFMCTLDWIVKLVLLQLNSGH